MQTRRRPANRYMSGRLRISRRSCRARLWSVTCFNKLELASINAYGVTALSRMYWHCEMYSMFTEKHLRVFSAWARSTESCELYSLSHKASSCRNPSIASKILSSTSGSDSQHKKLKKVIKTHTQNSSSIYFSPISVSNRWTVQMPETNNHRFSQKPNRAAQ